MRRPPPTRSPAQVEADALGGYHRLEPALDRKQPVRVTGESALRQLGAFLGSAVLAVHVTAGLLGHRAPV